MARKQNGAYNASISVQTPLVHLVANCMHPKIVRSALLRCPNTTVALRLLVNVVKVTNLGSGENRVSSSSFSYSFFFLRQPSALIPQYIAYNVHYTGHRDNEPFCDCVGGEVLRRLCLILGHHHTVFPYI